MADTFTTNPAKLWLWNLQEATALEAMFNPSEWDEILSVEYVDSGVQGLSYRPLHYQGTANLKVSFDLLLAAETIADKAALDHARRFLSALCYPWRGKLRPPRTLFSWVNEASITAVIRELKFTNKRFNTALGIVESLAKVSLEEVRDIRIYGDDVLQKGLMRGSIKDDKGTL